MVTEEEHNRGFVYRFEVRDELTHRFICHVNTGFVGDNRFIV